MKQKIPKIIHYCWFGPNEINSLAVRCIESWKVFAPDYEIKLWNEESFDIDEFEYVKFAYENKKYAFVTDFVRLFVLKKYGGIYLDSDVELTKSLDRFLIHKAFSGFEDNYIVPTGIMASVKNGIWVTDLLSYYMDVNNKKFIPNTKIITAHALKNGLIENNKYQELDRIDVVFYPSDYFCPKSHYTGEINITDNTHTIHHFNGSWLNHNQRLKQKLSKLFIKVFGFKVYKNISCLFK